VLIAWWHEELSARRVADERCEAVHAIAAVASPVFADGHEAPGIAPVVESGLWVVLQVTFYYLLAVALRPRGRLNPDIDPRSKADGVVPSSFASEALTARTTTRDLAKTEAGQPSCCAPA
jgi:hypothetical protein